MTDKQTAIAAIAALGRGRDLLELSSDQALHDAADDISIILVRLEALEYFGKPVGEATS